MNDYDPLVQYQSYLKRFGITAAGDRVAERHDLNLGNTRFYAYAGSDGLRLKAAVMPSGLITPGGHATDDWYGFLSQMPNGAAAATRIAWLETDAAVTRHGLPNPPMVMLTPDHPPVVGIDPAQWALVTSPALNTGADGRVQLMAWFLTGGTPIPTRWTITAQPGTNAIIEQISAQDLLVMQTGSAAAAAAAAAARARQLLATGTEDACLWALQHIGDTGDRTAVLDVATLLSNESASPNMKLHAAGTLARLADPTAVPALSTVLKSDLPPEVQRASAQALGRIGGTASVQVLTEAIAEVSNVTVRAEIVHALAAQGSAAYAALAHIARSDPEATIRELAQGSIAAMQGYQ